MMISTVGLGVITCTKCGTVIDFHADCDMADEEGNAPLQVTASQDEIEWLARALHKERHPTFSYGINEPGRVCGCRVRARYLLRLAGPR